MTEEQTSLDTPQELRAYLNRSEKAAKQKSSDDSHHHHTGHRETHLSASSAGGTDRRAYRYRVLSIVHRSRTALKNGKFDEAVKIAQTIQQIEES